MAMTPISRLLLAAFLWFSTTAVSAENLQIEIKELLQQEDLVGATWSLLPGDGSISVSAAGFSNAESREPMTRDHRVLVGSIAKVVLSTGVLRLVSEDRLSLETPIKTLLPELPLDNPWNQKHPIRVQHLLTHTAGLENIRLWQAFSLEAASDTPLRETVTRHPSQLRVHTRPGEQYLYSNLGYTLLGMVIEAVTSGRYEQYLDKKLLKPLSMHNSSFRFASQTGPDTDRHLAMGHFEKGQTQSATPLYLRPAGQFITTASDMAVFAHFLMSDGSIRGQTFIRPELLQAIGWPKGTAAERAGLAVGHGLSLAVRDRHGTVGLCHPGTTIGFRAMLCLYPEEKKAFFVAHNTDSENADYERFNSVLIRHLKLDPTATTPQTTPAIPASEWSGIYTLKPNGIEMFSWVDTLFNFVRIQPQGARLQLTPFQSETQLLAPVGGNLYRAQARNIPSHVFFRDSAGRQTMSNGLRTYKQIATPVLVLLWLSLGFGLAGILYICLTGILRLISGNLDRKNPLLVPLTACLALALPIPFFFNQSFLQLGDITVASLLLALFTAILPVALLAGLTIQYRQRRYSGWGTPDTVAMLLTLQWTAVLVAEGMVPLRLWG